MSVPTSNTPASGELPSPVKPPVATVSAAANGYSRAWSVLLAPLLALGLTGLFFPTLWAGGGLVGGDIYTYFFPQKQYLAERLQAGEIPFWNHRTGNGYPIIGESQTGVFYPPHLLYAVGPLSSTYIGLQLAHYVLAFVGCWMLARRWGLSPLPSCLAAVVYTYGWLPPRLCVEWAALGAPWFPLALWSAESFLQTARRRHLFGLSLILTLQILAGHFHLAFITQGVLGLYVPLRLWWTSHELASDLQSHRLRAAFLVLLALCGAFGLSAPQLLPTWELKQQSQRAALGSEHDPGYGYIPWWYLGQMVAPWSYYTPDFSLGETSPGESRTNTVEAHLYCGLLPLVLLVLAAVLPGGSTRRRDRIWWLLGLLALIYVTGVAMPVARHLPGFGFFNGVGRYGIIVNLAAGLLAAAGLQRATRSSTPRGALLIGTCALVLTTVDLWWVSGLIQHTVAVARPPIQFLKDSPLRQELDGVPGPVRLFSRGANLPNLLGVSSTPVYLGIGPQAYFDPELAMPQPLPFDAAPTAEQVLWMRRAGVTHVLSFTPLSLTEWPIALRVAVPDPFLNRAWGRPLNESFYLYDLLEAPGRAYWADTSRSDDITITSLQANSVEIKTERGHAGTLVLADLDWPGWTVTMDGATISADSTAKAVPYRTVEVPGGAHQIRWEFRSPSLKWGTLIGGLTLVIGCGVAARTIARRRW